jgi:hypothetical protein
MTPGREVHKKKIERKPPKTNCFPNHKFRGSGDLRDRPKIIKKKLIPGSMDYIVEGFEPRFLQNLDHIQSSAQAPQ